VKRRLIRSVGPLHRAWQHTKRFIESVYGVLLMAVMFAIFFGLPAHATFGDRALHGLLAAAVGFAIVAGLAFLYHYFAYMRSRGHDEWMLLAMMGGEHIEFCLERRDDVAPAPWDAFIKCVICLPDGSEQVLKPHQRAIDMCATLPREAIYGTYEVRWYGSQSKRRWREIMCSFVKLDETSEGHVYGVRKASEECPHGGVGLPST
jgi:hypothetical protein